MATRRRVTADRGVDDSDPICGLLNTVPARHYKGECSVVHLTAAVTSHCGDAASSFVHLRIFDTHCDRGFDAHRSDVSGGAGHVGLAI